MDQLHVGAKVAIMKTENVLHRVPHLIGTKGIVREVPQHPNTWYKVLCSDGEVYTLRPTAIRLIRQGDEGSDEEADSKRFAEMSAATSPLTKSGKGRGRGRGGKIRGRRNYLFSSMSNNGKSTGSVSVSLSTRGDNSAEGTGDNESRHRSGTDDMDAEGDDSSSTGMELDNSYLGRQSSLRGMPSSSSRRNEGFRERSNKSNGDEVGTHRDGSEQAGSSSSSNNGDKVKTGRGGGRRSPTLTKKTPLTSLDPEHWVNQIVAIVAGRLMNNVGIVLRSGNGWVQVLTNSGEVSKRAYELEVVNVDEIDEEWENQLATIEELEKRLHSESSNSNSKGRPSGKSKNSSRSPTLNVNEWNNRYSQGEGCDEDGDNSGALPDDYIDATDGFNSWGTALNSRSSRLPRAARRQRLTGKGFGPSFGSKRSTRTSATDSDNLTREGHLGEPRGLQNSRLAKDRGFGKMKGAKDEEYIEGDYLSKGPGKGMVGGKGEKRGRKDASTLGGAEGGRSALSPLKSERDRAKEAKEKSIEKQNAADNMRCHIEQQINRSKLRPNLSYWLKQLEAAGTDLSTDAEDVDASIEVMPLRCSMCLVEKMDGDNFCWNPKCMTSPIFEGYFHNGDTVCDGDGDVNMEKRDGSNGKIEEGGEGVNGRLGGGSDTEQGKASSTLSTTIQDQNSFQHRTIIDPVISYALYAPVKWIETRKRKNAGYENFSADPVRYRWQCWASSQGVGNSALESIPYHPYPVDGDKLSSASETQAHKEPQLSVPTNGVQN